MLLPKRPHTIALHPINSVIGYTESIIATTHHQVIVFRKHYTIPPNGNKSVIPQHCLLGRGERYQPITNHWCGNVYQSSGNATTIRDITKLQFIRILGRNDIVDINCRNKRAIILYNACGVLFNNLVIAIDYTHDKRA